MKHFHLTGGEGTPGDRHIEVSIRNFHSGGQVEPAEVDDAMRRLVSGAAPK